MAFCLHHHVAAGGRSQEQVSPAAIMCGNPGELGGKSERSVAMTTSLYDITLGQQIELHRILANAGLDAAKVAQILRQPELAAQMVAAINGQPASPATPSTGFFTPELLQIDHLSGWNQQLDLGLNKDQLDAAANNVPDFVWDQPLVPLTLCWTLDTLEATMNAHIKVIRHVFGEKSTWVRGQLKTDPAHLRQVDGAPAFRPNTISWKVIDLGANRDKSPDQVPAATAAGTEVYSVVAQHPTYVKRQKGDNIPYLDVPGLRLTVQGYSEPYAPSVYWNQAFRKVYLHANWADNAYSEFAEAVVVREF